MDFDLDPIVWRKRGVLASGLACLLALTACEQAPSDPVAAAQAAFASGQIRTAMERIDLAVSRNPDDLQARQLAGDIAMALGNADRAVSEYEGLVSKAGENDLVRAKLAEAQVMANYLGAAEQTGSQLEYTVPLAYTAAIAFALSQGDEATAAARLEEGLERFAGAPSRLAVEAERV